MRRTATVDRGNRFALFALGLVLTAAGCFGIVAGSELLGGRFAQESVTAVLGSPTLDWRWLPAAVGSAGLLLTYLGLRWVRAQLHVPHSPTAMKVQSTERGTTHVRASAVGHTLSTLLARIPGTADVGVRLLANGSDSRANIRMEIEDDADVSGILKAASEVVSTASDLTGIDTVSTTIRLVPVKPQRVQ